MKINLHTPIAISEVGHRARQEDSMCPMLDELSSTSRVFVVCDGLGGHEHGDVASATVAHALHEKMNKAIAEGKVRGYDVTEAVKYAHSKLHETALRFGASSKPMGTTMAMLVFADNGVIAAHIGDSRIYHIRCGAKHVIYRSRDHSLVNDLFLAGKLTRDEAESSPKKNMLTRAMLPPPFREQTADMAFITRIEAGDYFLLCSDGVSGALTDEKLLEVLNDSSKGNAEKMAAIQMLAQASDDNRTAILLQVESVAHEPDEKLLNDNEMLMCDKMVFEPVMPLAETPAAPKPSPKPKAKPAQPKSDSGATPVAPVIPPVPVEEQQPEQDIQDVDEDDIEHIEEIPPVPEVGDNPEQSSEDEKEVTFAVKKLTLKRMLWIGIAALLLIAACCLLLFLPKSKTADVKKGTKDSLPDPDVTIDSVIPEVPTDTFDVGTDVPVPPVGAPSIDYPTGSGVNVPSSTSHYNYDEYENYDNGENSGGSVETPENPPATNPEPAPAARPDVPRPAAQQSVPQPEGSSNRGRSVPPPPRRPARPVETP